MHSIPSLQSISARLRFKQLDFLTALADLGSLSRVGEQMAMTQPGATKMLHEIETTFGAQLFVRSKRGMVPNDMGRCVIRYGRLIQSDLGHLREEITGVLTGKGGRIAVGAIGTTAVTTSASLSTFTLRARRQGGEAWEPAIVVAVDTAADADGDADADAELVGLTSAGGRGLAVVVARHRRSICLQLAGAARATRGAGSRYRSGHEHQRLARTSARLPVTGHQPPYR